VRINSFSHVEECVLMDGVDVGRYARLRRVIVDRGVKIPPHTEIGFDEEEDRKRFHVSEGGVVVIPKGAEVSGPPIDLEGGGPVASGLATI
jgi:glucose-1-phosphate adenylyltransferase